MTYRSLLVISALLTLFIVGVATAPVAARSRTPGVSAEDEDDFGDQEIDSTTYHGAHKVAPEGDSDADDIDELNPKPSHQHPAERDDTGGRGTENEDDAR